MTHRYNREAVDAAIRQSRKPISGREARMIHAILQGPTYRPFAAHNLTEK